VFVAIYRWRLQAGLEQDFIANWERITSLGLAAGSGGSSLFKGSDGRWVAIARWPSREARTSFFAQLTKEDADPAMHERARLAVLESFPEEELESALDMWTSMQGAAS
jgi:heme-degrading monooxygenase HmoA